MISRKTAMSIASAYTSKFSYSSTSRHSVRKEEVYTTRLYDWLYERDYEAWFCNSIRTISQIRTLKDFFLRIHTGESLVTATPAWSWEKRKALGSQHLEYLARDFLTWYDQECSDQFCKQHYEELATELRRRLEIDGYIYRDGMLLHPETEILDVEAERGLLQELHRSLGLRRKDEIFSFLDLSEKHYVNGDWSDSIGNARKFFEAVLQEVANRHSLHSTTEPIPEQTLQRPVAIREYLEEKGLLEKREREALDKVYGLLSHTGSHPYMAAKDQARLLRQLSLTITQFILLRLEGFVQDRKSVV
jgi:hypothetical protein